MAFKFLVLALTCLVLEEVAGHGMLLGPPNRSSMWRFDPTSPPNYNDNGIVCGGAGIGKPCGVCGDSVNSPHPQQNENTGKYGLGKIAGTYKSGQVVETHVRLTTNHKGTIQFALCVLSNPSTWEPESCFTDLTFEDGSKLYTVPVGATDMYPKIKLPAGVKCPRCVLRWHYNAATTQEQYRNCADITIE